MDLIKEELKKAEADNKLAQKRSYQSQIISMIALVISIIALLLRVFSMLAML